jgi:hypothetical protein
MVFNTADINRIVDNLDEAPFLKLILIKVYTLWSDAGPSYLFTIRLLQSMNRIKLEIAKSWLFGDYLQFRYWWRRLI